jgi:GT2 family glycosyltransferase
VQISVGIPTRGRPEVLKHSIARVLRQSRPPERIFIAYSDAADILGIPEQHSDIVLLHTEPGLCRQRNAILRKLEENLQTNRVASEDIVLFVDDDFFLHRDYLHELEQAFKLHDDVVVATGTVLADGIKGPGLNVTQAGQILAAAETVASRCRKLTPAFNAYGCNMALRLSPIRTHGLRFDEALPLYGWYEDIDMSRRLAQYGRVVSISSACGVHLGTKRGRISGVRLGYSQVANPIYLMRKGLYPGARAGRSIGRNMTANIVRSLLPENYIDRRGRLRGNLIALCDLLRGRPHPRRILDLQG